MDYIDNIMDARDKIIGILNKHKLNYKIYSHEEIPTVEIAIKKVGFDIDHCMKTIAFEYDDKYIFVCVLAKDKIDYSKLCSELKISRSKLVKANNMILEKKYGYESGGISPISVSSDIMVVIDSCFSNNEVVYCGSGLRNQTIEIRYKDLLSLDNEIKKKISR